MPYSCSSQCTSIIHNGFSAFQEVVTVPRSIFVSTTVYQTSCPTDGRTQTKRTRSGSPVAVSVVVFSPLHRPSRRRRCRSWARRTQPPAAVCLLGRRTLKNRASGRWQMSPPAATHPTMPAEDLRLSTPNWTAWIALLHTALWAASALGWTASTRTPILTNTIKVYQVTWCRPPIPLVHHKVAHQTIPLADFWGPTA